MSVESIRNLFHNGLTPSADVERYHNHIGGSLISDECTRRAAFNFRWARPPEEHDEKTRRIFQLGKTIEILLLNNLKKSFINISKDSLSESQETVESLYGHFQGHLDGIAEIDNKKYILELKTHNAASFEQVTKKGVKEAFFSYYIQCQTYMHFSSIKECIYIGYNKNNCDLFIDILQYDQNIGNDIEEKATQLLLGIENFPKVEMYKCKKYGGCPFFENCHNNAPISKNCRTCISLEPIKNGNWFCLKNEKIIPLKDQEKGCEKYYQRAF